MEPCGCNDDNCCTYLENQAFFVGALQRKVAEPQIVRAILGQLHQKTRHAFWRGT